MFSVLRFVIIVGLIFYYSPVRQRSEEPDFLDKFLSSKKSEPATAAAPPTSAPAVPTASQLETVWQALPEGAKQAVVDKILTTSGLVAQPTDTLRPEDRQPAPAATAPNPGS